ncbi:MAG: ATP-dependent protease [Alphaproteobacteria bacterium]|jgi:lon-related putative ATP-dependent protease|nr:ATP-dependent protease [Alphaproteobacteria bacterium]
MKIKPLKAKDVGVPLFPLRAAGHKARKHRPVTLFDLSSHNRANEAMTFGLKMRSKGFHVFVVGEDRSGRMTATLAYLKQYTQKLPPPFDWVYLNNFSSPHRPKPFHLPNGKGYQLKQAMVDLLASIHAVLAKTFTHPHYTSQIDAMTATLETQVQEELQAVQEFARRKGLGVEETSEGFSIQLLEQPNDSKAPPYVPKDVQEIKDRLNRITTSAHLASRQLTLQVHEAKKNIAAQAIDPLFHKFRQDYDPYIKDWIDEMVEDVLTHVDDFLNEDPETQTKLPSVIEERYSVNLLINNKGMDYPEVVLEPSPTYENLFGSIKYRALAGGGLETNFTMIRPGALHRANGGILVLRAEALAQSPDVWEALKAALRDQRIRIEERHRESSLPLLDAPEPVSVPLSVQVFLIGAPTWYYSVFFHDTDFRAYFKIKAEIDPDLPATPQNISIYAQLIQQASILHTGQEIDEEAIRYLMGYSARWVGHRKKLNSKFELIADVLSEAGTLAAAPLRTSTLITLDDIKTAIRERRKRSARLEDRSHEDIESGQILIDVTGSVVGQVNGLSVLSTGDHQYGLPNRISARTYAGELGVINIERLTEMSGPIQQKGVLILDGYLNGMFAQKYPLSCGCSLTFEQNYSGVEGDSASLAELVAILSSLSGIPLRQDIAITGSINQFGDVQPVGGITHKIEGFYRTCKHRGLTGTQGVIIPKTNIDNVILRDDIVAAIEAGDFAIWPVSRVEDALMLLTGLPSKTIFNAVTKKLALYHGSLEKTK